MAEPHNQAEATPENPPETGDGERTGDGRFRPGNRANPGGRPKGLAREIRERYGDALVGFAGAVLSGYVPFDAPPDAKGERKREWREVTVSERIAVYRDLMDRGYGKAPQFAPMEDENPLEHEIDIAALAEGFEDELAARRQRLQERRAASGA